MKRYITLILILLTAFTISASPVIKTSINLDYSYDSNVYSEPLPQFDKGGGWLSWKSTHPFMKKHSIGASANLDLFFTETARTGLSFAIAMKVPLASTTITPVSLGTPGDFTGNWEYVFEDSLESQKTAVFAGFGPVFNAQLGIVDLGCAIRLSIGGYDYIESEVILGLQAEPYLNVYMMDDLYFNLKLTYDAHLMRFVDNDKYLYEQHYQMFTLAPSIGIGYRF